MKKVRERESKETRVYMRTYNSNAKLRNSGRNESVSKRATAVWPISECSAQHNMWIPKIVATNSKINFSQALQTSGRSIIVRK